VRLSRGEEKKKEEKERERREECATILILLLILPVVFLPGPFAPFKGENYIEKGQRERKNILYASGQNARQTTERE
jgi:hypothetical protein